MPDPLGRADLNALQGIVDMLDGHYGLSDWARACRLIHLELPLLLAEARTTRTRPEDRAA